MSIRYDALDADDIDLGVAQNILGYWENARGDAFAPAWMSQFKLYELPVRLVPDMTVIDRIEDGRNFRYRFWGSNHASMKGFEMTGKTIDQSPNKEIQRIATRQLETVIQRRRPTVFLYSVDYPKRHKTSEFILRLPLSSDGSRVDKIVSYQDLTSDIAKWDLLIDRIWTPKTGSDGAC